VQMRHEPAEVLHIPARASTTARAATVGAGYLLG